jgi:hypothetical protein
VSRCNAGRFWRQGYDPCLQIRVSPHERCEPVKNLRLVRFLLFVTFVAAFVACVVAVGSFAADVVTIEACGETVAAGRTAYLLADLDCRGAGTEGIILANRARLVLGGHTMLGDPDETNAEGRPLQGVRCEAGSICTIEGPGSVVGFSASGIAGTRVRVHDVYIAGNAIAGVSAFENVRLRGVSIARNGAVGVNAGGRVRADESDLRSQPGTPIFEWHAPPLLPSCSRAR